MFVLMSCTGMAPVWCPEKTMDGGQSHSLSNASLFDTPPVNKVDLEPITVGSRDVWDLYRIDPYLICRYSGTTRIVMLHPVGAKTCAMAGPPFEAYCR